MTATGLGPSNPKSKWSAYKPSGTSGRSLSWFLEHKWTRSISTPPWMTCYSIAGLLPSRKFAGTHLYTRVERGRLITGKTCSFPQEVTISVLNSKTTKTIFSSKRNLQNTFILPVEDRVLGRMLVTCGALGPLV